MTAAGADAYVNHYTTEDAIRAVADGVLAGTWPEPSWKHREHCVATMGFILFHPAIDLERELPGIIQRYNVAQGGVNSDTAGYHHTITLFYLAAIRDFAAGNAGGTPVDLVRRLLASPVGSKDYPLQFYSRERLFSREARLGWLAPDLAQPAFDIATG